MHNYLSPKLWGTIIFLGFCLGAFAQEKPLYPPYQNFNSTFLGDTKETYSLHWPNYMIAGRKDAKMQFSFKYRLLKKTPIYFAYTQKMFWNIYQESRPFNDINFSPEVFYRYGVRHSWLKSLDAGLKHLSNGRDEAESRSLNQFYIGANMVFHTEEVTHFVASTQAYYTFDKDQLNSNIEDYIGYYSVSVAAVNLFNSKSDSFDLGVGAFSGRRIVDTSRGGVEINLKYKPSFKDFNPSFLIQYYRGYMENMREYDKYVDRLRAGVLFYF